MITAQQIKQIFSFSGGHGRSLTLEESVDYFIHYEIVLAAAPRYSNTYFTDKTNLSILPCSIILPYPPNPDKEIELKNVNDYQRKLTVFRIKSRDVLVEELKKRGFQCSVIHESDNKWAVRIDW